MLKSVPLRMFQAHTCNTFMIVHVTLLRLRNELIYLVEFVMRFNAQTPIYTKGELLID